VARINNKSFSFFKQYDFNILVVFVVVVTVAAIENKTILILFEKTFFSTN